MTTVAQTMANLTTLQALDLTSDTGITGSIENGTASDNICKAVKVFFAPQQQLLCSRLDS